MGGGRKGQGCNVALVAQETDGAATLVLVVRGPQQHSQRNAGM